MFINRYKEIYDGDTNWININTFEKETPEFKLVNSDIENSLLEIEFDDFYLESILIDGLNYHAVKIPNGASNLDAGYPIFLILLNLLLFQIICICRLKLLRVNMLNILIYY